MGCFFFCFFLSSYHSFPLHPKVDPNSNNLIACNIFNYEHLVSIINFQRAGTGKALGGGMAKAWLPAPLHTRCLPLGRALLSASQFPCL